MHVCVIGAGVVGLTTAYFLQAERHTVTVVDRATTVAEGASGANGAQLGYSLISSAGTSTLRSLLMRDPTLRFHPRLDAQQWKWTLARLRAGRAPGMTATMMALARLAELSREFLEPLIEGEGIDCHFTRGGRLLLYADADWFAKARLDAEYQATRGLHLRALTAEQCFHHEPALEAIVKRIAGGIFASNDAVADCGAFCAQLAQLLAHRGVEFTLGRAIDRFDVVNGEVRALIASDASAPNGSASVRADAYVLAAGAQSSALGATAGIKLPICAVKGYSITVKPHDAPLPRIPITDTRRQLAFVPLGDRVRVSGFAEIGADPDSIPPARVAALLAAARETLGYHTVDGDLRQRTGLRPATPSGRPIIGRTTLANLVLNTGHGALGWTLAAGSARLVCDAIARRGPTIDATPYALDEQ